MRTMRGSHTTISPWKRAKTKSDATAKMEGTFDPAPIRQSRQKARRRVRGEGESGGQGGGGRGPAQTIKTDPSAPPTRFCSCGACRVRVKRRWFFFSPRVAFSRRHCSVHYPYTLLSTSTFFFLVIFFFRALFCGVLLLLVSFGTKHIVLCSLSTLSLFFSAACHRGSAAAPPPQPSVS